MKLNQESLEHGSITPLDPKDWAMNLLLFAHVSDFRTPFEYSIWVHKVAFAGKNGDEESLMELVNEMIDLGRVHYSQVPPNKNPRPGGENQK